MFEKLSVRDLDLKGKRVLTRVDFNVPIEKGNVTDDARIKAALPTIRYILDQGGTPLLLSHLGRPNGEVNKALTLEPCAKRLEELLGTPVRFIPSCSGSEVIKKISETKKGEVILLENLRFHRGEENSSLEPDFAASLAALGDLYVDDAFGTAHRAHASVTELPSFFPGKAAAGFLLEKEILYLGSMLRNPKRPFYTLLGGSKISTKFKAIQALMKEADLLLIGGAMAFTFLMTQGIAVGDSLVELNFLPLAKEILDLAAKSRCRLLLPLDFVIIQSRENEVESRIVKAREGIPRGWSGVDIGPETIDLYKNELSKAGTIFWNGPMGIFEKPPFDKGTHALAKILADSSATTIVGGGDSVAAVERAGLADRMDHLSTGGGASLEFIEFGQLPGINVLTDRLTQI